MPRGGYQPRVGRPSEAEIDRAVAAACAACNLHGDDVYLVASLVERPRAAWPACCGSGCDPCMEDVALAAEKACALLGIDPSR